MQTFKEKSSTNLGQRAPTTTTPYSSEFINFITESRKQQTLLANSLGNSKAEFNTDDRKSLEEFLSIILFQSQFDQEKKNCAENEKEIQLIADKIFKSFHGGRQRLQLSLTWIFYYSPNENQTNYLPVFQIRSMSELRTKYMDISFSFFDTWAQLIENVQVESSFLCVPRNGEYRSEEFVLDLEYMWSRPRRLNKQFRAVEKYKPFTISFVNNWIMVKVQQLGEIFSKAVTAAIAFYKAHHFEINSIIQVILVLATAFINPSSTLLSALRLASPSGATSHHEADDGSNAKFPVKPANQQKSIKEFENLCNNSVAFSRICMDAYKKRSVDMKSATEAFEKLSLITKDVKSLSKDLNLPKCSENITKLAINENGKRLENLIQNGNMTNGVLNGTDLSDSHILSPFNLNRNSQKYSVCTYYGSDFTEVKKMAFRLFRRDLKLERKSNKLFDFSGKHVGYVYFLPDVTICVYLTSEIELNESEKFKFVVIDD